MVYQLIYTSSATTELDDVALRELAHSSRQNNQILGITGLLLFHQGIILQILEGDKNKVTALYEKIAQDKRHTGCMMLTSRHAEEREFSDWFMGYKNVSDNNHVKTLFNLDKNTLATIMPHSPSSELKTLTRTYAKVSGLSA